jgi:O-acetyl-ADP-ribose deacetylase (regulator of RNase III)
LTAGLFLVQDFGEVSMNSASSERLRVVKDDITRLAVDAIVNAANESLQDGGGVCGAIHDAAGPELEDECCRVGGCPTGSAKLTSGYRVPAKYVIHAVGPRYRDGRHGEAELLRSCYIDSLRLAAEHGVRTIAFPSISTGIFGYPQEEAVSIAIGAVVAWLRDNELPHDITFCCFHQEVADLYRQRLRDLAGV